MTTTTFCEHEIVLVLETASALVCIVVVLRRSFFAGKATLVPTNMIKGDDLYRLLPCCYKEVSHHFD